MDLRIILNYNKNLYRRESTMDDVSNGRYADFAAWELATGVNRIPAIDPSQGGEGPSLYTNLLFSGYP